MPPKTRSHPRRRAKKAPKKAKKAVSFAIDTAPAPRVDPVEEVLSNQPLLEHVLSFLPMNVDIGRAASTNKAFKEACDSPAMWKARAERLPILTLRDCDVDYHRLNHQLTKAVRPIVVRRRPLVFLRGDERRLARRDISTSRDPTSDHTTLAG